MYIEKSFHQFVFEICSYSYPYISKNLWSNKNGKEWDSEILMVNVLCLPFKKFIKHVLESFYISPSK